MEAHKFSVTRVLLEIFAGAVVVMFAAAAGAPAAAAATRTVTAFRTDAPFTPVNAVGNNTETIVPDTAGSLSIDPKSGPVGSGVTVSGTGFKANAPITVTFDNVTLKTDGAISSADGNFAATFEVPPASGGSHVVEASDGTNAGSANFTVTSTATIRPSSGYIGADIFVTGWGFRAKSTIRILFDGITSKTVTSASNGSVNATFPVPAQAAGTHTVKVTDGINSTDLDFIINIAASINPPTTSSAPGYVGELVTAGGMGFLPGKTLTVTYDERMVASSAVKSDSTFSITFTVPPSKGGAHTITLSDGTNSLPLPFFVETTPPPAPVEVSPVTGATEPAQSAFSWTAVNDMSGVTYTLQIADNPGFSPVAFQKMGIATPGYTLTKTESLKPPEEDTTYYWRVKAVDGASNESTWSDTRYFTVAPPAQTWAVYTLSGLGGAIVILLVLWLVRRSHANGEGDKR